MLQELFSFFLSYSFTETQIMRNISLVRRFLEQYFFSKSAGSLIEKIDLFSQEEELSIPEKELLKKCLTEYESIFSVETFYDAFEDLTAQIRSVTRFVLYTSITLPDEQVKTIALWVRSNIHPRILLDIKTDTSLVGGCAFVWNMKYHDYSIISQFEKNTPRIISFVTDSYEKNTPA